MEHLTMRVFVILSLLTYTFGAFAFGTLAYYSARKPETRGCGFHTATPLTPGVVFVDWSITILCLVWFIAHLAQVFYWIIPDTDDSIIEITRMFLAFLFPPIVMHVVFAEINLETEILRSPWWKWIVRVAYVASPGFGLWMLLVIFRVIDPPFASVGTAISIALAVAYTVTVFYAVAAMWRAKAPSESSAERSSRRWMIGTFLFLMVIMIYITLVNVGGFNVNYVLHLVATSMPLAFIFIGTYHDNRYEFFDLFIKRGLALILTMVVAAAFFSLVTPPLAKVGPEWSRPWIFALAIGPLAMALPWLYRKLGAVLDNTWFGRRYTTVEAVKRFLSGLQSATSERKLIASGEEGLTEIFDAPARIDVELREAPGAEFDRVLDIPIEADGRRVGVIFMGRRDKHTPYFSQDIALLGSLSDVFAYMLENIRLQERRREHEQQAKELSLRASESELKALRAQINPHFLFNALNAIAGLIHKDPLRADATVEQLAEVFRYTLRGSDKEWAILDDEMDFVRAYLEVERARFGDRLRAGVTVEDRVKSIRIPTMMVQTLAENAVKHGISTVRGPAWIEIDARRVDDRLVIEVRDNGPGFDDANDSRPDKKGARYGLKNIRQRLEGHFGERAALDTRRDDERGVTVVSISMPVGGASASTASGDDGSVGVA